MPQFGRFFSSLLSNQEVRNVPVIGNLFTKGEGVGMKNAREVVSNGFSGMTRAEQGAGRMQQTAAKLQQQMAALDKSGLSEADRDAAKKVLQGRIDSLSAAQKVAGEHAGAMQDSMVGGIADMGKSIGRYFGATDMRDQSGRFLTAATRVGAAGGAYMGAATGARYLSGGGLTYNNKGERDIAGIPFI
jgi:hypothetical protein